MASVRLTGYLLAGGSARRFGAPKHRIRLGGATLLERQIDLLRSVCTEVGVIVNRADAAVRSCGARILTDDPPSMGPLGGIRTGLKNSRTRYNLFLACDMPFLTVEALELLRRRCRGYDVTLFGRDGFDEPLCAVYSRSCLAVIESQLSDGRLKILEILPRLRVNRLDDRLFAADRRLFFNVNTPGNLAAARRLDRGGRASRSCGNVGA